MAKKRKQRKDNAPSMDKLLLPAIGICLAVLGYQVFKGMARGEIDRVDVQDDMALREVFFGEVSGKDNYAVLCHQEESKIPVSSVFSDACFSGSSPAKCRLLDCDFVLPASNKTVADRFKLNLKKRPTVFVSGAVGPPKQVPEKHLKTGKMLDKLLKNMLEPRAAKIETTQDLRVKCLNQPYCGLLLKGSKSVDSSTKKAIHRLLEEQPRVAFASIDTSVLFAANLETEFLPEMRPGLHRFAVFKKISGGIDAKESRLVSSVAALPNSGVNYGQMFDLVSNVVSGKQETKKMSTLPMVKTRTKKVEAEEKAKRERKQRREDEKAESSSSSSSSSFTANDGSKEGRRAERERRRAEHRKQSGAKERTPEEIAEMERQRRIRMEEAAKAWTMDGEDDLPPAGTPIDDEEPLEDIMEDGEYFVEDGEDEEGDDDEEILDLD